MIKKIKTASRKKKTKVDKTTPKWFVVSDYYGNEMFFSQTDFDLYLKFDIEFDNISTKVYRIDAFTEFKLEPSKVNLVQK